MPIAEVMTAGMIAGPRHIRERYSLVRGTPFCYCGDMSSFLPVTWTTQHRGYFALTAQLLDLVRAAPAARVVTQSSGMAHMWPAAIDFDDLQQERHYSPWRAYMQSKLATLLFALELDRRARANGWGLLGIPAHPGYARPNLQSTGPRDGQAARRGGWDLGRMFASIPGVSQTAAAGALPG